MSAISHIKAATPARTRDALKSLYYPCYRGFVRSWCRLLDLRERPHHGPGGRDRFPPAYLRYRVSGTPSLEVFLRVGKRSYQDLTASLEVAGRSLSSLGSVLDFGCGCGRTISWLGLDHPEKDLHGTDIDDEAVDWCRANLPLPQFRTNGQEPPLEYSAETFDLVYAISVFTHLPERYQLLWLEEFRRILRPGGTRPDRVRPRGLGEARFGDRTASHPKGNPALQFRQASGNSPGVVSNDLPHIGVRAARVRQALRGLGSHPRRNGGS